MSHTTWILFYHTYMLTLPTSLKPRAFGCHMHDSKEVKNVLEWYLIKCPSKNKYQKTKSSKEIGLHAQNLIIIRHTSQHNWVNLYDHLKSTRICTLILAKTFIWAPNLWEKWLQTRFRYANHLALITCFIS